MDLRALFSRKTRPAYRIRAYAVPESRPADPSRQWFAFDPAEIYPATLQRIQGVLQTGEYPSELIQPGDHPTSVAEFYLSEARLIDPDAWQYALTPRCQLADETMLQSRARLLELARRWFTQALHVAVDAPVGIHILKGDGSFRL